MAYNYLDKTGLTSLWAKIKEKFVLKEHKTGSSSEYKVLSDNNLTDALVQKINNAGVSDFSGNYDDLTGKPQINGHELASGNQTAASLGLATPSDISTATDDMATQAWVTGKGYQTSAQVQQAVTTATTDMATQSWVTGRGYATTSSVQTLINNAVASVLTYKGTKDTVSALPPTGNKTGDVWHVTADNGEYAWNGTAWEALGSSINLSVYVQKSDMVAISTADINGICV